MRQPPDPRLQRTPLRAPLSRKPLGRARAMSPTVFRDGGIRVSFFSREEPRMHVHVQSAEAEAKFWMEPEIELEVNYGFSDREVG